jgi:CHAT domain-containing protein/cytochrome c-type biogenesis protein CcmH/NrfG
MSCPDEKTWFEVAGGTLPPEEATRYIQHAATCDSCSGKLRAATRIFQDNLSPTEEALDALPSSRPEQQRTLAEKLARVSSSTSKSALKPESLKRRPFWRSLRYTFSAAAVLLLVAFFSLGYITDQLLARAYSDQGLLEYRIAKASPPREGTRGPETERPFSLVLAELLIRARLALSPNSAYWVAEKGRFDLIQRKPSAISVLERAHTLEPNSYNITIDLASAYYLSKKKDDLIKSQELLLTVLEHDDHNLAAIYNLALTYEFSGFVDKAIHQWDRYLQLDSSSEWADEARRRREADLKKEEENSKARLNTLAPIDEWISHLRSGELVSEEALEPAVRLWLPHRYTPVRQTEDGVLQEVLTLLADQLQKQHGDAWLAVFLRTKPSLQMAEALELLSKAIALNNDAEDFADAALKAQRAAGLFGQIGSIAGMARSQLEEIYAYQRSTQGKSCVQRAQQLEDTISARDFVWIKIQLALDEASCFNILGRLQEAKRSAEEAHTLAAKFHYLILDLRASGIIASQATSRGDHSLAISQDIAGLHEYWSSRYPVERAFQFYSDITFNAESLGYWHVAYNVGQEVVATISQTRRKKLEAIARYRLAKFAIMLGKNDEARTEVEKSDALFADLLPDDASTLPYQIDGILGIARADADMGQSEEAVRLLQKSAHQFAAMDNHLIARRLHQIQGDLAIKRGFANEAQSHYVAAVAIAESALSTLRTPNDRLIWSRDNQASYKALINVLLEQNNAQGAFAVWEMYKAGLVHREPSLGILASIDSQIPGSRSVSISESQWIEDIRLKLKTGQILISFAFLPSGLVAWIDDGSVVTARPLYVDRDSFSKKIDQFVKECATPLSDIKQLRSHANSLYQTLLAPFNDTLKSADTLIFETDDELKRLPFEALIDDSDSYVGEHFTTVYSPGVIILKQLRDVQPLSSKSNALIVGPPELSTKWEQILPPLPYARLEAQMVASRFHHPRLLIGLEASYVQVQRAIQDSELFHFAAHSILTRSSVALVLARNSEYTDISIPGDLLVLEDLPLEQLNKLTLAVLSTCSTSEGNIVDSLVHPLLWAGVPQIVLARWEIDSKYTRDLMNSFYNNIFSHQNNARSLHNAETDLRLNVTTVHPYYWAGFILLGKIP